MPNKIDRVQEILEELYSNGSFDEEFPNENTGKRVSQARQELYKAMEKALPSEQLLNYAGGGNINWAIDEGKKEGFNQALSDTKQALKSLILGEK